MMQLPIPVRGLISALLCLPHPTQHSAAQLDQPVTRHPATRLNYTSLGRPPWTPRAQSVLVWLFLHALPHFFAAVISHPWLKWLDGVSRFLTSLDAP